jgi:hypothetical protein
MLGSLLDTGDRPAEVSRFVQLWLGAMAASATVAIAMLDYSIGVVGVWRALVVNFVLFGAAVLLLLAIARWRSTVACWLLAVPFNLLMLLYDLSHLAEEMARAPLAYLAVLRLGLMAAATWQLFTPSARAWFRGRRVAEE